MISSGSDTWSGKRIQRIAGRLGSGGVVSQTVGLSSVGPPPSLRINHEFRDSHDDGVALQENLSVEQRLVERARPILVGDHQEVG